MISHKALSAYRYDAVLPRSPTAVSRGATAAAFTGSAQPFPCPIKVVGCGSSGVDYLASVAAYPKPDEKLRTERLEVQGGGNCANALTAAARLGLAPFLVSKIGGDGLGDGILSELAQDGVDTQFVLRAEGHPSPFTYIIVDRQGGTRTCIHTPGAVFAPEEMTPERVAGALQGASLVYFDGRLTEAATVLARAARAAGIPVLVEGERLRPNLEGLLALADYVVTSAHFPQDWTGEEDLGDALVALAERLPGARLIVTTLGARGSVALERAEPQEDTTEEALAATIGQLRTRLEAGDDDTGAGGDADADAIAAGGLAIRRGALATTFAPVRLTHSGARCAQRTQGAAAAAAERAAALNADAGNAAGYAAATATAPPPPVPAAAATGASGGVVARVTVAAAAQLPKAEVVDTTGAGDAFIGSVVYGLVTGLPLQRTLQLAAVVAAAKCTQLGARAGLPLRERISAALLEA